MRVNQTNCGAPLPLGEVGAAFFAAPGEGSKLDVVLSSPHPPFGRPLPEGDLTVAVWHNCHTPTLIASQLSRTLSCPNN